MNSPALVRIFGTNVDPTPYFKGYGWVSLCVRILDAVRRVIEYVEAALLLKARLQIEPISREEKQTLLRQLLEEKGFRDGFFAEKKETPTTFQVATAEGDEGSKYEQPRRNWEPVDEHSPLATTLANSQDGPMSTGRANRYLRGRSPQLIVSGDIEEGDGDG